MPRPAVALALLWACACRVHPAVAQGGRAPGGTCETAVASMPFGAATAGPARTLREPSAGTALWVPPLGLDAYVPVPADNPITEAKVRLGCALFFDPLLSVDGRVRCASCHRPEHGFSDTKRRSTGVHGRRGERNAPSLLNVAYRRHFFWDGRVESLEEQVLRPIHDFTEMDLPAEVLLARLSAVDDYVRTFRVAFPYDPPDAVVTERNVARALASYLRTVLSGDSPADRFANGSDTLSTLAARGFLLFTGRAGCTSCHVGSTYSDGEFHNTGVSWGNGDTGRERVTGDPADRGAFRTPSLRDVARTAPYMHDGSLAALEEVVAFYNRGGRANPRLDPLVRPLGLTPDDRDALVAFLRALTTVDAEPDPPRPVRRDGRAREKLRQYDAFAGDYDVAPEVVARVFVAIDRLFISYPGQGEMELLSVGESEFTIRPVPDVHVVFERDADGRLTGFNATMGPERFSGRKRQTGPAG